MIININNKQHHKISSAFYKIFNYFQELDMNY